MKQNSKSARKIARNRRNPNGRVRNHVTRNDQVTELLKLCLQKVCELQEDLQRCDDEENDPEAAGYAACAMETLRFLVAEGLPPDHPTVKTLTEKLLMGQDKKD
ncbi:uncharacterized protein LOC108735812 [Agrilus planipennis]|uniref:Uncharacterized protein LOC108735812 n=1 Tax=Agrilus planipennis TaxID=224129 RepID=A0A1W4WSK8_AGRPL|nr:uncharacterized protein LOC108735812 [Agrilus planipennis]